MIATMKTVKEASERTGISEKLINSVIRQLGGRESLADVCRGGADAGFSGFTYYSDTALFFKRNRKEIVELVQNMADDLGENPAEMVAGFQCLGGKRSSGYGLESDREITRNILREYLPSVSRCLYGGRLTDDDTQVANALAWFALEEVARAFED